VRETSWTECVAHGYTLAATTAREKTFHCEIINTYETEVSYRHRERAVREVKRL
jgi:hypothetical protein